ncbi:mannose-6-phosphate isomerase [Guyanagaster necrorhizus]|uniref:Mannose-6-phosphate isomerase n=1 Tax=Guyanagaster necrorhizus TaxID=856835 RepID=A0A9P7W450_9AGAR|nr:mannose-6-phosphate isomerase [Guyanagaster necrorhizus MCA 3950]KAG7451635.1 mannose-6-phosphate isomerase [Guyanagaster necrorhizus MCA 3950]
MAAPVFKIIPTTQQYDWGKLGSNSKVAQLAEASAVAGFQLDEKKPYAELWMGTHPTSPSKLSSGATLSSLLKENPSLIGASVLSRFPDAIDGNLPFLFKVLSIEKALSIQTHPDKETAEQLHAQLPNIYKDPNHKPELALALTPFRALCGFLPLTAIANHLRNTPELSAVIPPFIVDAFLAISGSDTPTGPTEKAALKDLFAALMTAQETAFKAQLSALVDRYSSKSDVDQEGVEALVLRLNSQFPGDIGIFCAFLLNYVNLQPGEAIFLGAGEPHAYVDGDIIECMANSDNVIRAGLTPKLRDIPNLVAGLTYVSADASRHRVQPTPFSSSLSTLYDPPIPEFSVVQVKLGTGATESHRAVEGPSLVVVSEGKGVVSWEDTSLNIGTGDVVFIGAATEVAFAAGSGIMLYRALVEAK